MPEPESLEYLENELAKQITGFDGSRRFYRSQLYRFTMASAGLSALVTIFIALEQAFDIKLFAILALVISASITVIVAWDQFLSSRD